MAFTDDFTNGGGSYQALESRTGWTFLAGTANDAGVSGSGTALKSLGTSDTAYHCTDQGSADHYSEATVSTNPTSGFVCVRMVDANNWFGWRCNAGSWEVFKRTPGPTFTQIGSTYSAAPAGQVGRISCSGDTITFTIDGVERCGSPFTDSTNNTETRQGLVSRSGADPWLQDFTADVVGGGGGSSTTPLNRKLLLGVG